MNDAAEIFLTLMLCMLAFFGLVFLFSGSADGSVVHACKTQGYWQTGQTRIICHVEENKK